MDLALGLVGLQSTVWEKAQGERKLAQPGVSKAGGGKVIPDGVGWVGGVGGVAGSGGAAQQGQTRPRGARWIRAAFPLLSLLPPDLWTHFCPSSPSFLL